MSRPYSYTRPTFGEALQAWKALLQERGLPADPLWIFGENLCFEKDASEPSGFRLSYQTLFTPVPPDAEQIAYKYFIQFEAPVVFYRAGSSKGKSVCLVLCDRWFDKQHGSDDIVRRDEWLTQFRPGGTQTIEEITDETRWKGRLLRGRPLHDLDFCMTLRGVHEILAHGRVLTSYEHFGLRLLRGWHRMFGPAH